MDELMNSISIDTLSFSVRRAQSSEDLAKVCDLRAACYGRHAPALREHMAEPDAIDGSPSTSVFLCEDKLSGEPIGTMRVVENTRGAQLEIEDFIEVPDWLARASRCEMTRLVVVPGADPLAKPALWKAGYLQCVQANVQWLIIGARKPGLIRQYQYLGAKDLYEDQRLMPLGHGWSLPHRIFVMNMQTAREDWYSNQHRLLRFMVETDHPDIDVSSVHRPRAAAARLSLVACA